MKIAFLTCALNFDETIEDNRPVRNLRDALVANGHEVIHLDTDAAQRNGNTIAYPNLQPGDHLDCFIGFYPGDTENIPYFDQLEYLDSLYPSPVPYKAQNIARDKTALIDVFENARLPKPASYDGNIPDNRLFVLSEIENTGKPFVLKPDFGGSGDGIVKVSTPEEAQTAFDDFDARNAPFMMQHYIETRDQNGHSADYRAYVIGDRVLAGIKRTAQEGEWRTNLALGASISPHQFTPEQERDAVRAMQETGLNFGAVDILIDTTTGQHYICEVNDACSGTESIEFAHKGIGVAGHVTAMLEKQFGQQ